MKKPAHEQHELLKVQEVADLLRTTPNAIYLAAERGTLPGVVRERGRLLFNCNAIRKYVGLPPLSSTARAVPTS